MGKPEIGLSNHTIQKMGAHDMSPSPSVGTEESKIFQKKVNDSKKREVSRPA